MKISVFLVVVMLAFTIMARAQGWQPPSERDRCPSRWGAGDERGSVAAAEWLVKQNPLLVGADNWSVEVVPNPDPQASQPVHQIMLPVHGVHLIENLRLEDLASNRAYEFAFIVQPLKIQGGTGSTVSPVAIR